MLESAIYTGTLRHRRFHPKRHEFEYPIFMAFLDVDRLPELMRVSRWSGYNRFNWASYCERDHFGDPQISLRQRLLRDAERNRLLLPDGPIFLLTHLRYLGYNFNPVSFFYCHEKSGELAMVMAEVNNTFAETHNYWLTSNCCVNATTHSRSYEFDKFFHVSPFMGLQQRYQWTFTVPGKDLVVQSNSTQREDGVAIFDSTLKLERMEWTAENLRAELVRFPWMTAKVVFDIHWQALQLWRKGVPIVHHPGPGKFEAAPSRNVGARWSNK